MCKLFGNKLQEWVAASSMQALIHLLPILLQVFWKVLVQKLCLFNLMKWKSLAKQTGSFKIKFDIKFKLKYICTYVLVRKTYGKIHRFSIFFATSQILSLWEPTQSPMSGNAQIPIKWKYSVESHFILRLWVFEEIRSYYETKIIHKVWVM